MMLRHTGSYTAFHPGARGPKSNTRVLTDRNEPRRENPAHQLERRSKFEHPIIIRMERTCCSGPVRGGDDLQPKRVRVHPTTTLKGCPPSQAHVPLQAGPPAPCMDPIGEWSAASPSGSTRARVVSGRFRVLLRRLRTLPSGHEGATRRQLVMLCPCAH